MGLLQSFGDGFVACSRFRPFFEVLPCQSAILTNMKLRDFLRGRSVVAAPLSYAVALYISFAMRDAAQETCSNISVFWVGSPTVAPLFRFASRSCTNSSSDSNSVVSLSAIQVAGATRVFTSTPNASLGG